MTRNQNQAVPIALPTPFPVGPVNVYLLDGPSPALVDAGPDTDEARRALIEGLSVHGRRLSEIRHLIITHAHPDHFGLAAWVAGESGARVISHPYSVARMAGERAPAGSRNGSLAQLLLAAGVPPAKLEAMRQDFHRASRYSRPVAVDVEVNDGDQLALGAATWDVLHTPGHARGHICLYNRPSGQLLSGDHLLREISSNPVLEAPRPGETERPRSLVDYLCALERVAGLEVTVAWPGHGGPIEELRNLVARRIAFHQRRGGEIASYLASGPRSAYQISQALFPDLKGMQLFLGVSEVIGHLDILEDEGQVIARRKEMPVAYTPSGD